MSTNQTNIVNIGNLPEAQNIFDGNYLIVQNKIGTQIIDWANVGVIKLGLSGGGFYTGTLTGDDLRVGTIVTGSISGSKFESNGATGITLETDYYNKFATTNGLITSGFYASGSPEFLDIINIRIPAATAALISAYPSIYEDYATGTWPAPDSGSVLSANFTFGSLPDGLDVEEINTCDFTLAEEEVNGTFPTLSTTCAMRNIRLVTATPQRDNLTVTVFTRQTNLGGIKFKLKILKTFTVN